MKPNVALIGFMGSGKTAVGKVLAEKLNRRYVELDSLLKQKAGKYAAIKGSSKSFANKSPMSLPHYQHETCQNPVSHPRTR